MVPENAIIYGISPFHKHFPNVFYQLLHLLGCTHPEVSPFFKGFGACRDIPEARLTIALQNARLHIHTDVISFSFFS
jgi:hypothetical protein